MIEKLNRILLVLVALLMPMQLASVEVSASSAPTQFSIPDTTFTVKGFASPGAFVQIYDGDALIGTVIADPNGVFEKNFPAMTAGLHNIRLQYQDQDGRLSDTISQTISVRGQAETAVEYYLPPTLVVDPDSVLEGNLINFSGSTLPNATIEIVLDGGNLILRPQSDAFGNYSISVNTTGYYFGEHNIRATSLQGGLKSFQTQKRPFKVLPADANDTNPGNARSDLTPPVITTGGTVITELEGNLIRGTAPPYSQIIIYLDGEPIGSTFANSEGLWFFNVQISSINSEIRAVSCQDGSCSDFSNTLTFTFEGELGRCSSFRFWLGEYRFWGVEQGRGINVPVTGIGGTPPYEVLVDWGDDVTERFNHNDQQSFDIHHVYDEIGQHNASITMLDEDGCEYTRYFSVDVHEKGFDWRWLLIGLLIIPLYWILRKRFVKNKRRKALAR